MTLADEMTRVSNEFETAQSVRQKAVAAIRPALRGQLADGRASLSAAMVQLTASIERDLVGIFSESAIIRGRARDYIDQCSAENAVRAEENAANAETLRAELARFAVEFENKAAEGSKERLVYIEDVEKRVEATLAAARKEMASFKSDRVRAGKIWRQHGKNTRKLVHDMANPTVPKSAPKKRAKASKG